MPAGGIVVHPNAVLATSKDRLEAERRAQISVAEREEGALKLATGNLSAVAMAASAEPLAREIRKAALEAVDKDLVAEGLLTAVGGEVSPKAQERLRWERTVWGRVVRRLPRDPAQPSAAGKLSVAVCQQNTLRTRDIDPTRNRSPF